MSITEVKFAIQLHSKEAKKNYNTMVAGANEGSYCSYSPYSSNSSSQVKIKTCSCSLGRELCPSHSATDRSSQNSYLMQSSDRKHSQLSLSVRTNSSRTQSSVTVIANLHQQPTNSYDELKLSLASLLSDRDEIYHDDEEKEQAFQKWLAEKNRQRKEEVKRQEEIQRYLMNEKEKKLEQERISFSSWLENKKRIEKKEQYKLETQKQIEERKLKEEKERKQRLAEMKVKLWLKQKEERLLLSKMQEQINKIKQEEEKHRRTQMSTEAYENWLKNSKNRPKPVPSNQGLESLRTSVSVSFINPTPWVPNIDNSTLKPITQ